MKNCKFNHYGDCCNCGTTQYMAKCKQPCDCLVPMTNYDRIKAMSLEEMAEFLDDMQTDALFLEGTIHDLRYPTEWKQWLESEVQDDE